MTGVKIPDNLFIVAVVPVGEEGPVEAKCSQGAIPLGDYLQGTTRMPPRVGEDQKHWQVQMHTCRSIRTRLMLR
jgi:hypothetical protein